MGPPSSLPAANGSDSIRPTPRAVRTCPAVIAYASAVASSGNIGPGFDVLALGLELRCRVGAAPAETWSVDHGNGFCPLPGDTDLVLEAAKRVSDQPLALTVENHIPLGKGLGSSSAAYAAGAAAALSATAGHADPDLVFGLVTESEGHADNAAAAVHGGLIGVAPDGTARRLPIAETWRVVVAVPDFALPTRRAREVLPSAVERPAVVRSLSRLLALVEGLRTGDAELLATASGDELHEAPRASLHPRAGELMAAARAAGAAHAAWSGAGPSIIAFTTEASLPAVAAALGSVPDLPCDVRELAVARQGLIVQRNA